MSSRRALVVAGALGVLAFYASRASASSRGVSALEEGGAWSDLGNELANDTASLFTVATMNLSLWGLQSIKREESFSATVYEDQAGKPTIGYGHLIRPGEVYYRITEEEAERILSNDLADAELTVAAAVKVGLTQAQYDALVSFCFNVGAGAFRGSTLVKKLNAGDEEGAAEEFERWQYITRDGVKIPSKGLAARRARERRLFALADYGSRA